MTGGTRQPDCPRTDAVLAIYLDGDVGDDSGFELVSGESLRGHLLECDTCQRQLQRARRLDAVLAAHAGAVDGAEVDALAVHWFAATATGPTPATPVAAAAAPQRRVQAGIATLLVALSFGAWASWWFATRDRPLVHQSLDGVTVAPAAPIPTRSTPPAEEPTVPPAQPTEILIAEGAARNRAGTPRGEPMPHAADASQLACTVLDGDADADVRINAVEHLAEGVRGPAAPMALMALVQVLAGLGDRDPTHPDLHRRALDVVRDTPRLLGQLVSRLQRFDTRRRGGERDDLAVLTVATRVGERGLDAAILRTLRRQPELAPTVAAALRCDVRGSGCAVLLLDAWQDLDARGQVTDDAAPLAWFADQPPAMFEQLGHELRSTRSAPRRVHCLLALGLGSDAAGFELLLEHVQGGPFLQAHAAAFALALRPRHQLEELVARARADDGFLLRAALARAGLPAASAWVEALALDAEAVAALQRGAFPDFPRVANWFRDRAVSLGN